MRMPCFQADKPRPSSKTQECHKAQQFEKREEQADNSFHVTNLFLNQVAVQLALPRSRIMTSIQDLIESVPHQSSLREHAPKLSSTEKYSRNAVPSKTQKLSNLSARKQLHDTAHTGGRSQHRFPRNHSPGKVSKKTQLHSGSQGTPP